jgi:hypothetical protein
MQPLHLASAQGQVLKSVKLSLAVSIGRPMRRQSETWLLLPLLPILLIGVPPMLLFAFLGFAGLVILGILSICVGLADGLDANRDFNQQIIVHGYARRTERAIDASNLHSAVRFAAVMNVTGAGLIIAGLVGFFYVG